MRPAGATDDAVASTACGARVPSRVPPLPPQVRDLGRVEYRETWQAMREFTETRGPDAPDELWLVEHPPVFTLGQAGRCEHLFAPGTIPVVATDRGGQVTYHGPGQVVVYTLVDLHRAGFFVREWVRRIEEAVIETLASYGVAGFRVDGAPGVYVALAPSLPHAGEDQSESPVQHSEDRENSGLCSQRDAKMTPEQTPAPNPAPNPAPARQAPAPRFSGVAKIAALGIKVRRGCAYHGVALNVAMDLAPYSRIDPCGYPGLRAIDLATLGVPSDRQSVGERLLDRLRVQLIRTTTRAT